MLSDEDSNDIIADSNSPWADDAEAEGEEELEQFEDDLQADENPEGSQRQQSRPSSLNFSTTKSEVSIANDERKMSQAKIDQIPVFNIALVRRDAAVQSIIEARKFAIIENPYTRLAQSTLQTSKGIQHLTLFEARPKTRENDGSMKERLLSSQGGARFMATTTVPWANQEIDELTTIEYPREDETSTDRYSIQVYEDACRRLNVCPCSTIIRTLETTVLDLQNYGLGPRGCIPLSSALMKNATIVTLNLSGNNIGSEGMSYMYHVLLENTSIEVYDFSFNDLGSEGLNKLATAIPFCVPLRSLSIAGNKCSPVDMRTFLTNVESNENLKILNISHNVMDELGGIVVGEWLGENNTIVELDVSWCSVRLTGARALAKSIGDNNHLKKLNFSQNSFSNENLQIFTDSFKRNVTLDELDLSSNKFIIRFDPSFEKNPSEIITGKESSLYKMLLAALTNQNLKILHFGKNFIDERCLEIFAENFSKIQNLSLDELDLTGSMISPTEMKKIEKLLNQQSRTKFFLDVIRHPTEYFANNLVNLIDLHCSENGVTLLEVFNSKEDQGRPLTIISYEQFRESLRRAKIPFSPSLLNDIMKYLGRENDAGMISLKSLHS